MQCPNGHGPMTRGRRNWICEDCDCKVPLAPQAAPPPALPAAFPAMPCTEQALPQLPSLLAIPLQEMLHEAHPVMRLHRLCDAVEILTRFLTVVALGEVRRGLGEEAPLPQELLTVLQDQIQRPTFGQWRNMLVALVQSPAIGGNPVVPELPGFLTGTFLPVLFHAAPEEDSGEAGPPRAQDLPCPGDGGSPGGSTPDTSIVALRNLLAHGGGMTRAAARRFLDLWSPRLERVVEALAFLGEVCVSHVSRGFAWRLVGPEIQPGEPLPSGELPSGSASVEGHVVLLREERWLDLWPFCDFGRASASSGPRGLREAEADSPQVFLRADRDRLLYAALGVDLPLGERRDLLEPFRLLFRLEARVAPRATRATDYEQEIRADSAALVGRHEELRRAREAVKGIRAGVLWIYGPGGIGKSFLMARLAMDLVGDPKKGPRIVWRFKGSDQTRCSRDAFFRHSIEVLADWLGRADLRPTDESRELLDQLRSLLREVQGAPVPDPRGRVPRVLFVLDGLDEIQRLDPTFPQVPFDLREANVVWLCAGRPEGDLPRVFSPERCTHIFPGGLPGMTSQEIRGLLVDGTGMLKYRLVARDLA